MNIKSSFLLVALMGGVSLLGQIPKAYFINAELNDDFSGFEVFDSAAVKHRFILAGEDHRFMRFNSRMELKTMQYLHRHGFRNMIMELGISRGYVLQQYLNTGDSVWHDILKSTTGKKYMAMYQAMRDWNRELPDSAKLIVSGIDVERFTDLPVYLLEQLLPDDNLPADLRLNVEALKGLARFMHSQNRNNDDDENEDGNSYFEFRRRNSGYNEYRTIKTFTRQFDSLKNRFQEFLGDKFPLIDSVVTSLKQYLQWDDYEYTPYQYVYRENMMYENMLHLLKQYPEGKFFGQFGRCHAGNTLQNGECNWYNYQSIAHKMESLNGGIFKGQVATVGYFYHGDNDFDQEKLNKQASDLRLTVPTGKIAIFQMKAGNPQFPDLAERFDFILYNHADEAESEDEDEDSSSSRRKNNKYDKGRIHVSYINTQNVMDFYALNEKLKKESLPEFGLNNFTEWNGLELNYLPAYKKPGFRLAASWMKNYSQTYGSKDSLVTHGGRSIVLEGVTDLILDPRVHIGFGAGMGLRRLTMRYENPGHRSNFRSPSSPGTPNLYTNPAALISLSSMLKLNLGALSLGAMFGLEIDLSNSQWRQNGSINQLTPKTDLSNGYLQLNIGFSFAD